MIASKYEVLAADIAQYLDSWSDLMATDELLGAVLAALHRTVDLTDANEVRDAVFDAIWDKWNSTHEGIFDRGN